MIKAHLDFETRSAIDLREVGVHKYAEHASTGVWLFSWSFGDEIFRWYPNGPAPDRLLDHIATGGTVTSHNAMFERTIWRMMRIKYGLPHWPMLLIAQQDCTMARALTLNLPADLERLGTVLNTKQQKDLEGAALMKKMMYPRKELPGGIYEWWDEPINIVRLGDYCDQDVRTEIEADKLLPPMSDSDADMWIIDQEINDAGIPIDVEAVIRAVDLVDYAKKQANKQMASLTDGAVKKCTEVAKIVAWIKSRGIECEAFRKGDHNGLKAIANLAGDDTIRKVIELRGESSKTSTAKFTKWLECVCADNHCRGQYQFHGASQTLRWAGRLGQFQNLVRVDWDKEREQVEYVIGLLHSDLPIKDVYAMLEMGLEQPLMWLSKAIRGCIWAEA